MVKIDVISGFLGAGKTTLIRKLLKAYENEKVVLIENEFGDIGIDGQIIEREGFDVFEIAKGCICCIMKKDFVNLFGKILAEFNPDRIIIEPTGISILSEIIEVLNKEEFSSLATINSLITVIDGLNYLEHRECFGEFFEDQITNAGTLIISKSQMIEKETLDKIIQSLKELNKEAPIITHDWTSLTYEEIRELLHMELKIDFSDLFYTEYKPCSDNQFDTLAIRSSVKFSNDKLTEVLEKLKSNEFGQVIRAKGFLRGKEVDLEFSYASGEYEIYESKFESSGKLCIIGKGLNEKAIKELFKVKFGGLFKW